MAVDTYSLMAAATRRSDLENHRLAADLEWSSRFIAYECIGDGSDPHPLLVAPGGWRKQSRSIAASGMINDGRGVHSHATFSTEAKDT